MSILNFRQQAFCEAYVILREGAAAAIEAGYSAKRAKQTAYDLLQLQTIKDEIDRLSAIRDADFGMRSGDVLREIANVAMADIGTLLTWGVEELVTEDGEPLALPNGDPVTRPLVLPVNSADLTELQRRQVKSVSMSKEGVFKIELHDRLKALELLGKHLGLFAADNKQKGEAQANTIAALVAAAQGTPLMPNAMTDDD